MFWCMYFVAKVPSLYRYLEKTLGYFMFTPGCSLSRGAACSNSRPQPGAKTFGGLEGGGGVGGSSGQPPGSLEGGPWVPQHTYLNMIPMTR